MEVTNRFTRKPGHHPVSQKVSPWWKQPTAIIPIAISFAALAIATGSYWDSHRVDMQQIQQAIAAAEASQREDAQLVSFYSLDRNPSTIIVENRAKHPIYHMEVSIWLSTDSYHHLPPMVSGNAVRLGELPPCSDIEVNLHQLYVLDNFSYGVHLDHGAYDGEMVQHADAGKIAWYVSATDLYFLDINHHGWQLSSFGQLTQVPLYRSMYAFVPVGIPISKLRTKSAGSC